MGIRNCKKCGRVFADDNFELCPICRSNDDEEYRKVKDFLYDNPGADIQLVSEKTGVDTKKILKYLREGKLEIREDSPNLILDCERCGTPIKTGRFCDKCILEMKKEFRGAIGRNIDGTKKIIGKDSDRMYTAERRKKY